MSSNKYDLPLSSLSNATSTRVPRNVRNEHESSKPLIETVDKKNPPLAVSENDDSDDREVVTEAYPGVDDGFFNPNETDNPDVEIVPQIPPIQPRAGGDGESKPDGEEQPEDGDKPDSGRPRRPSTPRLPPYPEDPNHPNYPNFPYAPGFGIDIDTVTNVNTGSIPDINVYQHKKTLAQGMMDLALFSANANQLRYVLESYDRHPYYYPSLVMISISLIFQIAVGVGLIWNSRYNVKDEREICIANKINNFTIIGIFLITVINVFISAFGVASINPTT